MYKEEKSIEIFVKGGILMISLDVNPYTRPDNFQQLQRKPDYVENIYTEQEFIEMMNQKLEERRNSPEVKEHSIYNWANWFNKHHPDLAGKRCLYVNGAWRTAEEVQQIEIKEFEKQQKSN